MKRLLLAAVLAMPSAVNADVITGVYQTEPGDTGGFLHVQLGPCGNNPALTCGTIIRAYSADSSQNESYEHLGKPIVWDMEDKGNGNFGNGKIWAPDRDKTYNSKMQLNGTNLTVEGCVAFICRGQNWQHFQ